MPARNSPETGETATDAALGRRLLGHLERRLPVMLARLGRYVRTESPSTDKAALDRFAHLLAGDCRGAGAKVEVLKQKRAGDHVVARWAGSGHGRPILLLGHYDTVYPLGTLSRTPFRVSGGYAAGPGTLDMKGGLVVALAAVEALRETCGKLSGPVMGLFTSDEEVGSESSRAHIEGLARRSRAVLVLEPGAGERGKLKTGRKGVGEIEVVVQGRSAHAGLDADKGVNAIHELALQIERIRGFNNPGKGTTVNVDVVEGGTRTNVIAERARAVVDLRVSKLKEAAPLERRFRELRPVLAGAELEIRGGMNRPPMERSAAGLALFRRAREMGEWLGLELEEAVVGGGSDGNFTAAIGAPTLDGLGVVGEGAHSPRERIRTRSLAERAALLGLLLSGLAGD